MADSEQVVTVEQSVAKLFVPDTIVLWQLVIVAAPALHLVALEPEVGITAGVSDTAAEDSCAELLSATAEDEVLDDDSSGVALLDGLADVELDARSEAITDEAADEALDEAADEAEKLPPSPADELFPALLTTGEAAEETLVTNWRTSRTSTSTRLLRCAREVSSTLRLSSMLGPDQLLSTSVGPLAPNVYLSMNTKHPLFLIFVCFCVSIQAPNA
jgi:hypothetical protein